jgi:ABC-type transport system substrate-binding protein
LDVNAIIDEIASGRLQWGSAPATMAARAAELRQRYGVNKSQFFAIPGVFVRVFVLNTSRPLFRNNPKLRQGVNFAADRKALTAELGPLAGTPTDQFLSPWIPGYKNARIYPLKGPDLRKARALARGRTRGGKAVLYTTTIPLDVAQAQVLQRNLKAIGLDIEIKQFSGAALFTKLTTEGEPFDIGRIAWGSNDPAILNDLFHGRMIGPPTNGNLSRFNSPKFNRLLDRAARLTGEKRYRAYEALDLQLSRDAAPAIPATILNSFTFVSARVGCVVNNPFLNLTAVCLK